MHAWSSATFKLALALSILAVAAAGEGHDHGGTMAFEWGGIFDTPDNSYTWAAQAVGAGEERAYVCLLYTSPSPRDKRQSRMPSSA